MFATWPISFARADRLTVSLDGRWDIEEGTLPDSIPEAFTHSVPVPGLANLATPAFERVDAFYSREQLANRIRAGLSPKEWLQEFWNGKVDQDRNYFYYRKVFRGPEKRQAAILKINKAQFGTAVWLNGQKLGDYSGCFSASYFHVEDAIRWKADNTLIIRIGAHPAVLPDTYPTGSDFEKIKWTPGIYDSVSLICCDNPLIETIQIAPHVDRNELTVQTRVKNCSDRAFKSSLVHAVRTWKTGDQAAVSTPQPISLEAGEEKLFTQTIALPNARLWSPEDPFLYVLKSSTGGDSVSTRFGMREFRFDAATKRAYLNGKVYFLRGSNITLHRFLEDPLCKDLPWKDEWVRKLLGDLPKKMHWNYFRFCIGPVPDRWLDICDEVGLLVQNEFFVWTGRPGWYEGYSRTYDTEEMIRQYKDWMRDNWNHPSVAVWDANNETEDGTFGEQIIPAVRPLDLSQRAWENSYNPPADPNDPVEDHPYLMAGGHFGTLTFKMSDLETRDGSPAPGALPTSTNPPLVNEYGWLWLNRDGSPTRLTERVYSQLMGDDVTARERLDMWAYLLAGKTEFWRAHRKYAGIIHFVYLTCSYPGVYTSDHFQDVTALTLDPAFADYVAEAFKPLGVYINFFQPALVAGQERVFQVMMVNDDLQAVAGNLVLSLEDAAGTSLVSAQQRFELAAAGNATLELSLTVPAAAGKCTLKAVADPDGAQKINPTVSRRWVSVE
ncbi:MAG: glycoside hydrolase family 2 TIM barrel-domain containing protein [Pirellulaceae bacterium]